MSKKENNIQFTTSEGEIDLLALLKVLWVKRKLLIYFVSVGILFGLLFAFTTPKQYRVSSTLVPQVGSSTNKLGGLSSLAAMAGFKMDMPVSSELNPMVYPKILNSNAFKKDLMYCKFDFERADKPITLFEYFTQDKYHKFSLAGFIETYTIRLPEVIIRALTKTDDAGGASGLQSKSEILSLNGPEYEISKILTDIVFLSINDKDGYLVLTVNMPEAKATAQLGHHTLRLLQEYITKYRIEKAEQQLEFIQSRFDQKKKDFETAQLELANFRDKNKFVSTAVAKTQEEKLQSEYQLAFEVYSELAQQLEAAKIKVKEETPVLTVIEPISIPNKYFKPKRKNILILWMATSLFLGICWIFGQIYYKELKRKWNQ